VRPLLFSEENTMMLVNNTEARCYGLSGVKCRIDLMPGMNRVDPKEWEKVQTPLVKKMIEAGIFVVEGKKLDITKMTVKAAVELVKKTVDEGLLKELYEAETRAPVLKAIEAQAEAIAPPHPKDEDDEKDE
jgi:hypothetical protein